MALFIFIMITGIIGYFAMARAYSGEELWIYFREQSRRIVQKQVDELREKRRRKRRQ